MAGVDKSDCCRGGGFYSIDRLFSPLFGRDAEDPKSTRVIDTRDVLLNDYTFTRGHTAQRDSWKVSALENNSHKIAWNVHILALGLTDGMLYESLKLMRHRS